MSQAKELQTAPGNEQLNGLLLPLARNPLLVPMSAVAEVITVDGIPEVAENGDPRLYGWIEWRKVRIPLLSYEAVCGGEAEPLEGHTRIAVINAVGPAADLGFYGIRMKGFPSPLRISDSEQIQEADDESGTEARLLLVILEGARAEIPNFEFLESICASAGR